jgi:hypothetical protein
MKKKSHIHLITKSQGTSHSLLIKESQHRNLHPK